MADCPPGEHHRQAAMEVAKRLVKTLNMLMAQDGFHLTNNPILWPIYNECHYALDQLIEVFQLGDEVYEGSHLLLTPDSPPDAPGLS